MSGRFESATTDAIRRSEPTTKGEELMCPHCADGLDHGLACRLRVLQLLALIEHPSVLPASAALRIGQELLAWIAQDASSRRCDQVLAAETPIEAAA
jgi:hypothetical protein